MNKIIIYILISILLGSFVFATGEPIDSQTTDDDFLGAFYNLAGNYNYRVGSNFTASKTYYVGNLSLKIAEVGVITGTMNVSLHLANASGLAGEQIGMSDDYDASTIGALKWWNFSFSTPVLLTQGVNYVFTFNKHTLDGAGDYVQTHMAMGLTEYNVQHVQVVDNDFKNMVLWNNAYQFDFITYNITTPSVLSVTLKTPTNAYHDTSLTQAFSYNVTPIVDNCSLWINSTGTWHNNQTNTSVQVNRTETFNLDLPGEGNYVWNVKCYNGSDDYFAISNFSLVIDTTNPTITFLSGNNWKTDNTTIISSYFSNLTVNVSFYDINLFATLLNITNETGQSVYSETNTSLAIHNLTYNLTLDLGILTLGNYTIQLEAVDSHTKNSINSYEIKEGLDYIRYGTEEGNTITIQSKDFPLSKSTEKLDDRYSFRFKYLTSKETYTYRVTSSNKLYYLPKSGYAAHFVIMGNNGGNWLDFEEYGLRPTDYKVTLIDDYTAEVEVNSGGQKEFNFYSLGGLNSIKKDYKFQIGAILNITTYDTALSRSIPFTSLFNNITKVSGTTNRTAYYNVTYGSYNITIISSNYTTTITPTIINITQNYYTYNITMYKSNVIDDCSLYSNKIVTFVGKDEEVDIDVNMSLDITVFHTSILNSTNTTNASFIFRSQFNYSICTNTNQTFYIDSIMEYGDGITYTERKYYLNNYTANSSIENLVYLYHLNETKTSEIIFTVFDTSTGDKVPEAYIKILRYYPGEGISRIVEVAKTDEIGQTLGKMVLVDVFYKFIIEKPAGTVKLSTDILRILSLTRSFGISFVEDYLDTWNKINDVSYSVTCTKGTKTCRIIWSDTSNIVQDVTLEVWRITGIADQLLYRQTTASAAGTISYTIIEDTTGNTYVAKGFIESNTGTSTYGTDWATLIYSDNLFFTDSKTRIASLFPLLLLAVALIFVLIDFGAIGVVIGSLLSLIVGSIIGILPLDGLYIISFILMAVILIFKLSK